MLNKIVMCSEAALPMLKRKLAGDSHMLLVEINGETTPCLEAYLHTISDALSFPETAPGLDGYNDWICDLTWLDSRKKIAVIISGFSKFLRDDAYAKQCIIDDFREIILPWWESDVADHVVGGTPRAFSVYLAD